jgi:hypothetical protein
MAQHAFTELLNNAIDHSGGTQVTVSMRQTAMHVQLLVSDDGCGLFQRIGESFDIDDPELAMFELAKGKLTSEPERHTGRGLFFTARLADVFDLHANGTSPSSIAAGTGAAGSSNRPIARQGTSIYWRSRWTPHARSTTCCAPTAPTAGLRLRAHRPCPCS